MFHYEGIGLSANQVGISERVFIIMLNIETEETITCFNPRIVKRYEDEDKEDHKIKLDGLAARVFLHEFDHLEGIVFTQRQ